MAEHLTIEAALQYLPPVAANEATVTTAIRRGEIVALDDMDWVAASGGGISMRKERMHFGAVRITRRSLREYLLRHYPAHAQFLL